MLNNYCITIGFMLKEPSLVEDEITKEKVCTFTLVTQDHGKTKEVPCMATGKSCDTIMVYGQKGSFWAVGGIFYELETVSKKTTKKKTTLKCLEFELLRKPEIPGFGVEEFFGKYSPKAIIKRAKENRKCG
jgi:hypothetical protein